MLNYLLVLVFGGFFAWMIYRYDMYDREPWYVLLAAAVLGGVTMLLAGRLEDSILGSFHTDGFVAHAAVVAVIEEMSKVTVVILIATFAFRHFNDPMDGLIYGCFAGLGAALVEAFMYLPVPEMFESQLESVAVYHRDSSDGDFNVNVLGAEIIRLALHLIMGGLDGFALGMARFRIKLWPVALIVWLTGSMVFHFTWDWLCGLPALMAGGELDNRAVPVALMSIALLCFGGSVVLANHWSRQHLAPESKKRLWSR